MSDKPAVFISYKVGDPLSERVVEALRTALRTEFDVRWDKGFIGAGDPWRKRILGELHRARAAIVVLSPAAVTSSPWVKFEASTLLFLQHVREASGGVMPIVPIVLPGVDPESLKKDTWDVVQFTELQELGVGDHASVAETAEKASKILRDSVSSCRRLFPVEAFTLRLAEAFKPLPAAILRDALEKTHVRTLSTFDQGTALATALLRCDLVRFVAAVRVVVSSIEDQRRFLLEEVFPLALLSPEARASVLDPSRGVPDAWWCSLSNHAHRERTLRWIVQAVAPGDDLAVVVRAGGLGASEDVATDLDAMIRIALRPELIGDEALSPDEERALLLDELALRAESGGRLVVHVDADVACAVEPVLDAWRGLEIVVVASEQGRTDRPRRLWPGLDPSAERHALNLHQSLNRSR